MDVYDDSPTNALLSIVSNQGSAPFRMIVYDITAATSTNFDQATNELTYTKFSNQGTYIFTSSADNKLRMYKFNSNTLVYAYTTLFDLATFGSPFAITSTKDKYLVVAAG